MADEKTSDIRAGERFLTGTPDVLFKVFIQAKSIPILNFAPQPAYELNLLNLKKDHKDNFQWKMIHTKNK